MKPSATIELSFDRPAKRYKRFHHTELGVVWYVPNALYEELGQPQRLEITLTPAAPRLEAVA